MKTVLSFLLASLPLLGLAQTSHWRYSLAIGRAKPFTQLTTAKPIPEERLRISSPANVNLQGTLERSVSKTVSLRASIGLMPIGYATSSTSVLRDTTGRTLSWTSSYSGNSVSSVLTTGTLGVTLNSRAYGRAIFTAGLDGVVRLNGEPDQEGRRWGGSSSGYTVIQGDTQRYEARTQLTLQAVSPVTFGLAARLGMDYRLSKRGLFSVEVRYTKGFGYVRNAVSDDLLIDGVTNTGRYTSRASNVAVHVGYKHSLFRVNPLDRLQFTPYNQFELKSRFLSVEERLTTFRAKSMLYELRGGYVPQFGRNLNGIGRVRTGSEIMNTGGTWGYFLANRHMVGLSVDYQRYNGGYLVRSSGNLIQVGPIFRTYATRQRLSPYLEGGYQVGWFNSNLLPNRFVSSMPFTMGMSIRVDQSTRINLSYATRFYNQGGQFRADQSIPQLSFSYVPKVKSILNPR